MYTLYRQDPQPGHPRARIGTDTVEVGAKLKILEYAAHWKAEAGDTARVTKPKLADGRMTLLLWPGGGELPIALYYEAQTD